MADYSIFILGEANFEFTNGVTLDGITQGDGSQLVGETLTINTKNFSEIFISDSGSETNFADNDAGQRLDGDQTIPGNVDGAGDDIVYTDGTRIEAEYQFVVVDDVTGIEYLILAVNIANSNPIYGTSEAIAFVDVVPPANTPLRVISAQEGPTNGGPQAIDEADIVPICFCKGTTIRTPDGSVPVEALLPGDFVLCHDGSTARLLQVFKSTFTRDELREKESLRPVRIQTGALGQGLPRRDVLVSRQHRFLASSKIAARMFGREEVLIAAIRLTELSGISVENDMDGVEYFHLLTDGHQIIFAEGAPTETMLTGPEALKAVGPDERDALLAFVPELGDLTSAPNPARFIPSGARQRAFVARSLKNRKSILYGASVLTATKPSPVTDEVQGRFQVGKEVDDKNAVQHSVTLAGSSLQTVNGGREKGG